MSTTYFYLFLLSIVGFFLDIFSCFYSLTGYQVLLPNFIFLVSYLILSFTDFFFNIRFYFRICCLNVILSLEYDPSTMLAKPQSSSRFALPGQPYQRSVNSLIFSGLAKLTLSVSQSSLNSYGNVVSLCLFSKEKSKFRDMQITPIVFVTQMDCFV